MRLTRSQRAALQDDGVPEAEEVAQTERKPLESIDAPNATADEVVEDEAQPDVPVGKKASKGKKGAKGKGKKGKKAIEEEPEQAQDDVQVVLEDEREAAASPASEEAVEDLREGGRGGEYIGFLH